MSTKSELLAALAAARGDANSRLPDNTNQQITPEDIREALRAYDLLIEDIINSVQHLS